MSENKTLSLYPIDYPFETLLSRMSGDSPKLQLDPDFQRTYKWDNEGWGRASKFIESCLMRIPLPSCYFAEREDQKHLVIDGVQRLTTIKRFFNDEFALEGLTTFKELEGKKFSQIGDYQSELEATTIRCIVLRKENPKELIREIFSRLNQGAVKLTEQEIRHALYPGKFNDMLSELGNNDIISKFGLGISSTDSKQGREPEEQILRFFAFKDNFKDYPGKLHLFLDLYMEEKSAIIDDDEILEFKRIFNSAIRNCVIVFEENVFSDTTREKPKQAMTYYDLLMTSIGLLPLDLVELKKNEIRNAFKELCLSDDFRKTSSGGLQNKSSITKRRELWNNLLGPIINA